MNINQAKDVLRYILSTMPDQAAMLWGLPGVGKSEAVRQIAAEAGMGVIETRLSQMDPVDFRGVPAVVDGTTEWMTPAEFPKEGCQPTIWFLDEINAGSRATMASAMQLVLDRRIGTYTVPANVVIWAAGNETTHGAVANAMPSALSNRFLHLEVEPDLASFVDYGLQSGMDYMILNFLRYRPELLHDLGKGRDIKGFPSPRTWEFVSKMDVSNIQDLDLRSRMVASAVGQGAASELLGFMEVFASLPSLQDVLSNPNTAPVPEEPSAKYMVVTALVNKAEEGTLDAILTYLDRVDPEFAVMAVKDILASRKELAKCEALVKWEIENHNLMH